MRKDTTPRDMLFDRRVVERNIKKGLVSREEYDKLLTGLADVAEQAEEVRARLGVDDVPEPKPASAAGYDGEDDDDEDDEDEADEADDVSAADEPAEEPS